MKSKKNFQFKRIVNRWLILLIIVSFIPLLDLFHDGLPAGHDTQDHVARIANFYQNLEEGSFIPRWAGNLNWGYGHPILMFLYPLPSYAASLFYFFGFSLVDSTKVVFALGFLLSGLTMYLWTKEMWGEKAGFISALLYLFAPYRFVDLYVRGAIGENFFFIWPPLTCYFLYKLAKEYKWIYIAGGAFSTAFMVLSHNALTIMFLPFIFLYAFILFVQEAKNKLRFAIYGLLMMIYGFLLSSFFLLPAFFEGKYTLRDIVTAGEYVKRFESLERLIYSKWSFGGSGVLSVQIGIFHWLIVLSSLVVLFYFIRKRDGRLKFLLISVVAFILSIILMLPVSNFIYQTITILQKFQFPWRFLSLSVFQVATIGGIVFSALPKKIKTTAVILSMLILLFLSKDYWQAKSYQIKPESFYTGIYHGTTDTGESAPIWSVRFMEKEPIAKVQIVEGDGNVDIVKRTSTEHIYKINIKSSKGRILENTLYFPGWFVYINGLKIPVSEIYFQDPSYRGLINFYLDQGYYNLTLKFEETKFRQIADIISLISLMVLFIIPWFKFPLLLQHIMKKKN